MDSHETFAVALVGEIDTGWLVDATSAEEAVDIREMQRLAERQSHLEGARTASD